MNLRGTCQYPCAEIPSTIHLLFRTKYKSGCSRCRRSYTGNGYVRWMIFLTPKKWNPTLEESIGCTDIVMYGIRHDFKGPEYDCRIVMCVGETCTLRMPPGGSISKGWVSVSNIMFLAYSTSFIAPVETTSSQLYCIHLQYEWTILMFPNKEMG